MHETSSILPLMDVGKMLSGGTVLLFAQWPQIKGLKTQASRVGRSSEVSPRAKESFHPQLPAAVSDNLCSADPQACNPG